MDLEKIKVMKVAELKAELKARGLSDAGVKQDLINRLLENATKEDAVVAEKVAPAVTDAVPPAVPVASTVPASSKVDGVPVSATTAKHAKIPFPEPAKPVVPVVAKVTKSVEEPKKEPAPIPKKPVLQTDAMKNRLERFGVKTVTAPPASAAATLAVTPAVDPAVADAKLRSRAERFKLVHPVIEKEKKLERAKRFGVPDPELDAEKAKKRAERFGVATPELEAEKAKKRAQRFGVDHPEIIEDKKRARLERFMPAAPVAPAKQPLAFAVEFEERQKMRAGRSKEAHAAA